jgi:phage shock protein E
MIRRLRPSLQIAAIALGLAALASCSPGTTRSSISQAELADRLVHRSAPLIIDVRTPAEFDSGHIPGAVNIPYTDLPRHLGELKSRRDEEIVVYCDQGGRSTSAASALRGAGFAKILHLEGDMRAWRTAHLPCAGC